ncbi:UNVERIFIED_CONTAM: hypothetical protein RMT77_007838 [Armadillidium vulgare]
MEFNGSYFNNIKKIRIFLFLLLTSVVAILLVANMEIDVYQIYYGETQTIPSSSNDLKFMAVIAEKNVTFPNKTCANKFKLRHIFHLKETYDDVIIERHPNLLKFLTKRMKVSSALPDIPSIRWTGTVFQESWEGSPKFLLYSAHFDTRLNSSLIIHILALSAEKEELNLSKLNKYSCQLWFKLRETPTVVPIYDTIFLDYHKFKPDRLNPYVLSCLVPEPENGSPSFPVAVSIIKDPCERPTNLLKVSSSPIKKKEKKLSKNITVGVCGKALFYYNKDFSIRLIEWIEILKVLGASKIFLYNTKCHQNVQKVLDFYEKEGIVKLITFYYPPPYDFEGTFLRLWSKKNKRAYRGIQNIYVNDCILRNKDDFDYLGVFDSDEIPILRKHSSFQEFFGSLKKTIQTQPANYFLKWRTVFRNPNDKTLPQNPEDRSYCFHHTIRTKLNSKERMAVEINGKSFFSTNQVVWANPHTHISKNSKISPPVRKKTLPKKVAYMGHFNDRECHKDFGCFEGNMENETALLPFKEKVLLEMNKVLGILQI